MSGTPTDNGGKPLIGIAMGDPLGIGPEVLVKALSDPEIRSLARFLVFGMHDVMELAADQSEISQFWWREPYDGTARVGTGVLVADFDDLPTPIHGHLRGPDEHAGRASFRFFEQAVNHLRSGELDALVTGPICKESWQLSGHAFAGHTDYLARRFDTRRIAMMFSAGGLRVVLASDHIPLLELRNRFSIGMVHQPIDLLDQALKTWWGIPRPRIGVLGLNPHAGENGLLGDEEVRVIEPALTLARNGNIHVTGPLSPDTAFTPEVLSRFDGMVAMYHDQGLIPLKLLAFHEAVNVTLGLPVIRTSPDHGTAFGIAGRNKANPGSMTQAIRLAVQMAQTRRRLGVVRTGP